MRISNRFTAQSTMQSVLDATLATGGLSPLIAPFAESIQHVEPWLTLHGLRLVYGMNVE